MDIVLVGWSPKNIGRDLKSYSLPVDLGLPRPSSEGVFDLVWSKGVLRSLWGVTDLGRVITDHKDNNSDDYVQMCWLMVCILISLLNDDDNVVDDNDDDDDD